MCEGELINGIAEVNYGQLNASSIERGIGIYFVSGACSLQSYTK